MRVNESMITRRERAGFTLIELLVVIAIIALLAAILFPVFTRARENARRSSCQSNLKQIGLGIMQYQQDYDESMPIGAYYNTSNATSLGAGWYGAIFPYVKSTQVADCPSDYSKQDTGGFLPISYAENMNLAAPYKFSTLASWQSPTLTVMACEFAKTVARLNLGDEGYWAQEGTGTIYQYPLSPTTDGFLTVNKCNQPPGVTNECTDTSAGANGGYYYQNTNSYGGSNANLGWVAPAFGYLGNSTLDGLYVRYLGPTGRHLDGSNFLMADGHVKWMLPTSVSPGTAATPGKYQGQTAGGESAASTSNMLLADGATPVAVTFSPD